jgi:hypothetical protein
MRPNGWPYDRLSSLTKTATACLPTTLIAACAGDHIQPWLCMSRPVTCVDAWNGPRVFRSSQQRAPPTLDLGDRRRRLGVGHAAESVAGCGEFEAARQAAPVVMIGLVTPVFSSDR